MQGAPVSTVKQFMRNFNNFILKRFITASASTTKTCNLLQKMSEEYPRLYAKVNIYNFPFTVSRQDRIVLHRLKDVKIGDILRLDRIREIGSPTFTIKGRPWVSPEYCSVEACVIEHGRGEKVKAKEPKKRKGHQKNLTIKPLTTTLLIRDIKLLNPQDNENINE